MNVKLQTAVINLWIAGLISTNEFLIARETKNEFQFQFQIGGFVVKCRAYTDFMQYVHFESVEGNIEKNRIDIYRERLETYFNTLSDCQETSQLKDESLLFWKELKEFIANNGCR